MEALLAIGLWRLGGCVFMCLAGGLLTCKLAVWETEKRLQEAYERSTAAVKRRAEDEVRAALENDQATRLRVWKARGGKLCAVPSVGPRRSDEAGPFRRKGTA